jgi:hypothetical protein
MYGRDVHPEELERFIRTAIRSVWALELLLLLAREPDRAWTEAEVDRAIRGNPRLVRTTLAGLVHGGLVHVDDEGRYRFAPANPALGDLVARLAAAYAATPLAVLQAILESPNDRLRSFADAFRVRKDET